MTDFTATHTITVTDRKGTEFIHVMECEGALFTRDEWDAASSADWSFGDDGSVRFQGATPIFHGRTTCTIAPVGPTLYASYVDHNEDEILRRARTARAIGEGMEWGQESHTLAQAAADMGAHVHTEVDEVLVCELSDRLYVLGMSDGGPWAVEVADQEDIAD